MGGTAALGHGGKDLSGAQGEREPPLQSMTLQGSGGGRDNAGKSRPLPTSASLEAFAPTDPRRWYCPSSTTQSQIPHRGLGRQSLRRRCRIW